MGTSALSLKLKKEISAPLYEWLDKNPDGAKRLKSAGISDDGLNKIKAGLCADKFLFQFKKALEAVTGLSMEIIFINAVKRELWGNADKFPGINTREELISELRRKIQGRHHEVKNLLHCDGSPSHFERDVANVSRLWAIRTAGAFRALEYLCSPRIMERAKAAAPSGKTKESADEAKKTQRITDSVISVLNSLSSVADAGIIPELLPVNRKMTVAAAIARLSSKLGIDAAAIAEFRRQKPSELQAADLQEVLGLFKEGRQS